VTEKQSDKQTDRDHEQVTSIAIGKITFSTTSPNNSNNNNNFKKSKLEIIL